MTKQESNELRTRALEVLSPLSEWAAQCHAASIALVRAGVGTRVARGTCERVGGQHSWVVVGNDCYAAKATIIDPTLWSYYEKQKGIYVGPARKFGHRPHGAGSIWTWGKPLPPTTKVIRLTPKFKLSRAAEVFLEMLGPLDRDGWYALAARAPVECWPAGEIYAAIDDTKGLTNLLPIDRLGMLTDRNPGKLYLRTEDHRERRTEADNQTADRVSRQGATAKQKVGHRVSLRRIRKQNLRT